MTGVACPMRTSCVPQRGLGRLPRGGDMATASSVIQGPLPHRNRSRLTHSPTELKMHKHERTIMHIQLVCFRSQRSLVATPHQHKPKTNKPQSSLTR